jgi:hypothetical protein
MIELFFATGQVTQKEKEILKGHTFGHCFK